MIVWVPENIATLVLATSGVSDLLLGAVKGFWNFQQYIQKYSNKLLRIWRGDVTGCYLMWDNFSRLVHYHHGKSCQENQGESDFVKYSQKCLKE